MAKMTYQKYLIALFMIIMVVPIFGRNIPKYKKIKSAQLKNNQLERKILDAKSTHQRSTRSQTQYYLDEFNEDHQWQIGEGWEHTDANYYSSEYSINSFEDGEGVFQTWSLTSPVITIPQAPINETIHYSFWLRNDMEDGDGDGDGNLDDYFSVSLLLESETKWVISEFGNYEEKNYWCGDEELGGYGNQWVQYLDTPVIESLPADASLSAMFKWSIEDTEGAVEENIEAVCENGQTAVDGWDQANVQISTNNGESWSVIQSPDDPYDFQCGYGTVFNGLTGTPGWSGIEDWHDIAFDLSEYVGQDVIIRFAFYSDPSFSMEDTDEETFCDYCIGFQVDNIHITANHETVFLDNADGEISMLSSGENWKEEFYDYWDDGTISGTGEHQPGSLHWEEYGPGTPFNDEANTFLDLTEYAGQDVRFRFQTHFDGNVDGGLGTGLYIDDFQVYSEFTEFYPSPSGLTAVNDSGRVKLSWSNYLNFNGSYTHILDNDDEAQWGESTLDCGSETDCETFIGNPFYISGNSKVDTIYIYNSNSEGTEVEIGAFSTIGQNFNNEAMYLIRTTLDSIGWNSIPVNDWQFSNPFILAHTITDEIAAAFDNSALPLSLFLSGSWEYTQTGFVGIRANITKESSDVSYNLYRKTQDDDNFNLLEPSITDSTYYDDDIIDNTTYTYTITATYPDETESEAYSSTSISVLPSSYHELSLDDGFFESSIELENNDSLTVRFSASPDGQDIVRFKWYQLEDGGIVKIIVWEDLNGQPGEVLYNKILSGVSLTQYWNEYDLSSEGWNISNDFWIGIRAYSQSQPIGLSYKLESNTTSFKHNENTLWETISNWNAGIRVYLDCESDIDECGICGGDGSSCLDCAGIPNGNSVLDMCGTCDDNTDNDCVADCLGIWGGNAEFDECGVCDGGVNNIDDCEECLLGNGWDCLGVCGGDAISDDCGVCDGDNSTCIDSCGIPNGGNECVGCMEPSADNYDENATVACEDDCCEFDNSLSLNDDILPSKLYISALYPNPFNPLLNIEYEIPHPTNVYINVINIQGKNVDSLKKNYHQGGYYHISWNANGFQSGIYFIQIHTDVNTITKKVILLK